MEIQLDFISSDFLITKGSIEKIDFILQKIKKNVIVVLEEGLTPKEETELIETTMREIDAKEFHGIEFYRIDHNRPMGLRNKIADYISGKKTGLTIVGPTRMVEAIKKDPNGISMLAKIETSKKKAKPKSKKKPKKKAKKKTKKKV